MHAMKSMRVASRVSRKWSGVWSLSTSALPVEPRTFNQGIVIDKDGKKTSTGFKIDRTHDGPLLLETKNSHEMDSRIIFNEDTHEYYFDGALIENSCTGLINRFFEKFDADLVIEKMMTGA